MPRFVSDADVPALIAALNEVVSAYPPTLPTPVAVAPWEVDDGLASKWHHQDSMALQRLVQLGVPTEDLYALARGIRAHAIADVLNALDPDGEGELAGEFFGGYLGMPDD